MREVVILVHMKNTKRAVEPSGPEASDGLLDKWELAPKLRISKRSLDNWMKRGWLPYIKLGRSVRFRWSDVVEQLAKYRVN